MRFVLSQLFRWLIKHPRTYLFFCLSDFSVNYFSVIFTVMEPGERKRCREAEETTGRDSKRNKMEIEAEGQAAPHHHHIILSVEESDNVHSHPVVPREYKLDTNLDIWVEETESVTISPSPYTVKRYIWDMTITTSPLLIILVSLSLVVLPLIKNSFFSACFHDTSHSLPYLQLTTQPQDILSLNSRTFSH